MKKKNKILILDGGYKKTLSIVRNLGQEKNYILDVVSHKKRSISFYSRYVNKKIILPPPEQEPDKFKTSLLNLLIKNKYLLVIPVSHTSFKICAEIKKEILQYSSISIATIEQINFAANKASVYKLSKKLGIPYPPFYSINNLLNIEQLNWGYPVVIKNAEESISYNKVHYLNNPQEALNTINTLKLKEKDEFIIQKYIKGNGAGFFAYYKNGKCQNYFIHRRIREYPVSGGSSTVAEAMYDKSIYINGKKILDQLKWEGVAMVEFKMDNNTGVYNLMEINAKYWGSLDLSFICGVNFPKMMIEDALNLPITKTENFKHKRFQWILNGDLLHIIENPSQLPNFIRDLFTANNDFWIKDIIPNIFQLLYIPIHFYKKIVK